MNCRKCNSPFTSELMLTVHEIECRGVGTTHIVEQCHHSQWVRIGRYRVGAMSYNATPLKAHFRVLLSHMYLVPGDMLTGHRSKLEYSRDIIYVHWPDMTAIPQQSYNRLITYVSQLIVRGYSVSVGCQGGHGRTGTVLAGLIRRIEGLSADAAIAVLRGRYCESAIETPEQEKLVKELKWT